MLTNIISIVDLPPVYCSANLKLILERIKACFPALDAMGREQYLCDLLNVTDINLIKADFINYQEVEPAIDVAELEILADRVIGYSKCMDDAKSGVLNTLDAVPKGIDDLSSYLTEKHKSAFVELMAVAIMASKAELPSIENLNKLTCFDSVMSEVSKLPASQLEYFCGVHMDSFQAEGVEAQVGLTSRQKYLGIAAQYWLLHTAGFNRNSMWIAQFITSAGFGCPDGWFHKRSAEKCLKKHFGFKNDLDVVKLVYHSLSHITDIFEHALSIDENIAVTSSKNIASSYVHTMILTLESIFKLQQLPDSTPSSYAVQEMAIRKLLKQYINNFGSSLDLIRFKLFNFLVLDFSPDQIYQKSWVIALLDIVDELNETVNDPDNQQPLDEDMWLFDALNFFAFDMEQGMPALDNGELPLSIQFVQSQFWPVALAATASACIATVRAGTEIELALTMSSGFLNNFLRKTVQEDSENQILFDTVYQVNEELQDRPIGIDLSGLVKDMAELGHLKSMNSQKLSAITEEERLYWTGRIEFLEHH